MDMENFDYLENLHMEYCENSLTCADYIALRESVGWNNFSKEQVLKSIQNSIFDIVAAEHGQTVAMGRLIGDGMYYLIADIIVRPEYQGKGIGSGIVDRLLAYVEANTPTGGRASVQLIAEKGKEDFYIKKGFKRIPHEFCGSGMRKVIKK